MANKGPENDGGCGVHRDEVKLCDDPRVFCGCKMMSIHTNKSGIWGKISARLLSVFAKSVFHCVKKRFLAVKMFEHLQKRKS